MGSKTDVFLDNKKNRILFILFAVVMMYLVSYIFNPYSNFWLKYFERPIYEMAIEWIFALLFCFMISEASLFINRKFNKFLPWTTNPVKRLALQTIFQILAALFIILLQVVVSYLLFPVRDKELRDEDILGFWQWIIISVFIALMISGINTLNYLITNWKSTANEAAENKIMAAEHKQAAIEAELQALKLQLDPHFVFNNLSVLSELILEDQQLGYTYAENFAKVYRYLLVNSKKDIIALEEELKFLNAYIFLIENRVGGGVVFEINIDKSWYGMQIPPLTLQILIENALKHNKTLKTNPLKISVSVDENERLVVSNSLFPLDKKAQSSGIGLSNIFNRYKLLGKEVPEVTEGPASFIVSIPLIKV